MSGPDRKIRYTRVLAVLFVIAGFAAIGGGWYGMIRQDQTVDKQFPYLISGGAAGIALLLFGVSLLVIAQIRTERRRLATTLERVAPARSTGALSAGGPAGEADQSIPGRYVRMFGMAVCAAGFASIALGWNGAARLTVVDQQFPFLMSGGVLGVALVLFGVGVLLVSQIRTERQKLSRLLERLAGTLGRPSVDSMSVAAEGNGSGNGLVMAGPSTYHRFDCALINGRPGLDRVTVEAARARGLSECRVCRPLSREERTEDGPEQPVEIEQEAPAGGDASADGGERERDEPEPEAEAVSEEEEATPEPISAGQAE